MADVGGRAEQFRQVVVEEGVDGRLGGVDGDVDGGDHGAVAVADAGGDRADARRQVLVGRMARRALFPGQPIPSNAVEDPWTVARGAQVKVVVEDNGLSIVTYGSAMQSGAAGALIPVRNTDTGVIIRGIVQPDGRVRTGQP